MRKRDLTSLAAAAAAAVPLIAAGSAGAVTIDLNGYPANFGVYVNDGATTEYITFGSPGATINLGTLDPNKRYYIDWFQNSGANSSDMYFDTGATGNEVIAVSTNQYNVGSYQMVTGFTPGDATLVMNTQTLTYNANNVPNVSGQTGIYYLHGSTNAYAIPGNAGPQTVKALPGSVHVDNLYNPGQFNEDYGFIVNDSGGAAAAAGYEQYASFSGSNISPNSIVADFHVTSSGPLPVVFVAYQQPPFDAVVVQNGPATWEYTFSIVLTPGNAGQLLADFQNGQPQTFIGGDAVKGDNSPWLGTVVNGDVMFAPKLQLIGGIWHFVTTNGLSPTTFSTITGTDDGGNPITVTISATVPEPAALGLLALSAPLALRRRRGN